MSKRAGFTRRFIQSQRNFSYQTDGINSSSFGVFNDYHNVSRGGKKVNKPLIRESYNSRSIPRPLRGGYFIPPPQLVPQNRKEAFDLVNLTFPNKVYVCVDKDTKKYAIGYDPKNKSISSPVIVKPVNLHDKSQWICSDAGAGILNFFYSLSCFIHIEIERSEEYGNIIPVMRSDIWQNAFFNFGDNGEIFVDFNKGGKSAGGDRYCLAYRKDQLSYSNDLKTVSELASEWNKEYKYFDSSSVQNYDPDGNKKESFISKCWRWLKEDFVERMDGEEGEGDHNEPEPETPPTDKPAVNPSSSESCFLELVNYSTIDKEAYNYTWAFQEVWDIRTATNIALETKQISDLEEIDKLALENKELAYQKLKSMYEADKALWEHEKSEYDSHFMTKYYTMDD